MAYSFPTPAGCESADCSVVSDSLWPLLQLILMEGPFKLGVVEKMRMPLSCFVKDVIISLEGPGHQHFSFLAKFYITEATVDWATELNWTELLTAKKKKNTQTKHWKFCFI